MTRKELSFEDVLYEPMHKAFEQSTMKRTCKFSDLDYLHVGVGRCLSIVQSGRDWVQKIASTLLLPIKVGNFFDVLRSSRRLRFVSEISKNVRQQTDSQAPVHSDPFADHEELDNFAIYAADGHFHSDSVHENRVEGKRYGVGHIFGMSLRTQSMIHLDVTRPKVKKEAEITALKRIGAKLRMGEPKGRQVIVAYDPAVVDFDQWYNWKQALGLYIITREKKNMVLRPCGDMNWDRNDPRNNGVISDQQTGNSKGTLTRRIVYIEPVTGKTYVFITNEMTLPPGLICFIYKKRWDIEKVFDEFKNKLVEKKAWAKTAEAKCAQAEFMVLTHNLMLMMERLVEKKTGIVDSKNDKLREKRLANEQEIIKKSGRKSNPLTARVYKAALRTVQFIRWLRYSWEGKTSWQMAIRNVSLPMEQYLC